MARPTTFPTWATNTNYAGGPDAGTASKVSPSAGRFADGWRNNDVPPAQEQNFWQNLVASWVSYFDNGNTISFASLAGQTGVVENTHLLVDEMGWYSYHAASGFTADATWVVTATGMGAGQWVHESVVLINLGKLAAVGPVPGGVYTAAAGRILASVVPSGYFTAAVLNAGTDSTTSGTAVTTTTGTIMNVTPSSSGTISVGTLAINDVVDCRLSAVGLNVAGTFVVGAYISFDGGSTWTAMSPQPGGGSAAYDFTAAGTTRAIDLGFVATVTANGTCQVRFKFNAVSAGTTTVTWGPGRIRVERP